MNGETVFNYAVGILALLSAVASTALYYQAYLPSTQMKILDELLTETKGIYDRAVSEGLLPPPIHYSVKKRLSRLEKSCNHLRLSTYNATTSTQEYMAWFHGLSRKIRLSMCLVKKFRATLITASEKQRQLKMEQHRVAEMQATATAHQISRSNQIQDYGASAQSPAKVEILRPGSCPPKLDCAILHSSASCALELRNGPFSAYARSRPVNPSAMVLSEATEFDDNLFLEIDNFATQTEMDSLSRSSTLVEPHQTSDCISGSPSILSRWLTNVFKTKLKLYPDVRTLPV